MSTADLDDFLGDQSCNAWMFDCQSPSRIWHCFACCLHSVSFAIDFSKLSELALAQNACEVRILQFLAILKPCNTINCHSTPRRENFQRVASRDKLGENPISLTWTKLLPCRLSHFQHVNSLDCSNTLCFRDLGCMGCISLVPHRIHYSCPSWRHIYSLPCSTFPTGQDRSERSKI